MKNKAILLAMMSAMMLVSISAMAQPAPPPERTEAAESIEIKPRWHRFVSAPIDEMPLLSDIDAGINEALDTCEDRVIMCAASASGAEEAPDCRRKKGAALKTCLAYNQELAKRRIRFCRTRVADKGGQLPPGKDVSDPIDDFIPMGIGGDRGRGVILTCFKESIEYMRAKVGALSTDLASTRGVLNDAIDPEKEGSLASRLGAAEDENQELKKALDRLERLIDNIDTDSDAGAFNVFRVSADFRLFADTKTTGGPAIGLDLRVGFDVPLGVDYETYVTAGYFGGAARKADETLGVAQGASLQWRFPITLLPEHRVFIWAGPELFALALQDDFRTSREILVGGGATLGFEWYVFNVQLMGAAANYGDRSDGTAGAAFVFSAMFGINIPLDPIGIQDRRDARKRQQDRFDALRAARDAAPPAS